MSNPHSPMLTPLDMHILLHYHECKTDYPITDDSRMPLVRDALRRFRLDGLIVATSAQSRTHYEITDVGRIAVRRLCEGMAATMDQKALPFMRETEPAT